MLAPTVEVAEEEYPGATCSGAATGGASAGVMRSDGDAGGRAVGGVGGIRRRAGSAGHAAAATLLLAATVTAAPGAQAQSSVDERPNAFAMTGDLLVARPLGLVMTAVGTAAFVVSLPLTALAGSVAESAEMLVLGPAETTFVRCLGCLEPGYSYKDVERRRLRREEKAAAASGGDR